MKKSYYFFSQLLLAACIILIPLSFATGLSSTNQGNKMSENNIYFDFIKQPAVVNPTNNNEVVVQLKNSPEKLILFRNEKRFDMWSGWLKDAHSDRKPVYIVARKQDCVIQDIQLASLRHIDSLIMSPDKQQLKVGMLPSPSYYHVLVNHPRFKELQETLQRSLDNKKQVYIVLGGPLEIVDVRALDQN